MCENRIYLVVHIIYSFFRLGIAQSAKNRHTAAPSAVPSCRVFSFFSPIVRQMITPALDHRSGTAFLIIQQQRYCRYCSYRYLHPPPSTVFYLFFTFPSFVSFFSVAPSFDTARKSRSIFSCTSSSFSSCFIHSLIVLFFPIATAQQFLHFRNLCGDIDPHTKARRRRRQAGGLVGQQENRCR